MKQYKNGICKGCLEDLDQAIRFQDIDGFHLVTSKDIDFLYPNIRGKHFIPVMCDDSGNIVVNSDMVE